MESGTREFLALAQAANRSAHRANVGIAFKPPYLLQQMLVGQHVAGVGRKLGKRPVLDVGELDEATVEGHQALDMVDG